MDFEIFRLVQLGDFYVLNLSYNTLPAGSCEAISI